ncbi:MAG: reverse transcriptase/maturase family protein [Patescibacteria group bacterium]
MNNRQNSVGGGLHKCNFEDVVSVSNLLHARKEFGHGKRSKKDVARYEINLEDNLFDLHERLASLEWIPDSYEAFFVQDPKLRKIHKASVRDRVFYQAVYRILYQIFDVGFIFHSYSSRENKGTHAGVVTLESYVCKATQNYRLLAFALKCDIRKFFDSIDHNILFSLIQKRIKDEKLLCLIHQIIASFAVSSGKGLPLGNVTSQLFANIYMNELDQYAKRVLKAKYYARYCDDFVIVSDSKKYLEQCIVDIEVFCKNTLLLDLHPNKIIICKTSGGIDFLGYVLLPHRRVLRFRTKARMLRKLKKIKFALDNDDIENKFIEQGFNHI